MTVSEVMTRNVATCTSRDDLAAAGKVMQAHKCGFVPVVDTHGAVVGVVTDRDLCLMMTAEAHRTATHVAVTDAMSHPVFNCFPDDSLEDVLATMGRHRVRRLPVVDAQGHLQGVLSIDEIVQACGRPGAPTAQHIVDALKALNAAQPLEGAAV